MISALRNKHSHIYDRKRPSTEAEGEAEHACYLRQVRDLLLAPVTRDT